LGFSLEFGFEFCCLCLYFECVLEYGFGLGRRLCLGWSLSLGLGWDRFWFLVLSLEFVLGWLCFSLVFGFGLSWLVALSLEFVLGWLCFSLVFGLEFEFEFGFEFGMDFGVWF